MRSACSKESKWATIMTTSSDNAAANGGSDAVVAAASPSQIVPAMNEIGVLAGIDAGPIDQIASNVFAAMSGSAAVGASGTLIVPETIPLAMLPGTTESISNPGGPMPNASAPGAAAAPSGPEAVLSAMIPGTTVPMADPGAPIPTA